MDALRLESALVIREDRPAVVQLVVSATLPGVASFRLASQDAGSGAAAPWVVHATGSLRVRAVTAGDRRADVGEGRDPEPGGERHYEAARRRGLGYGSAFQGVTAMSRHGAEIVTRVRATDAVRDDGDAYRIHPALLDACFQGSLDGLTGGAERERVTYVPTGLERLTLHARVSGTDALRCRISPRAGRHSADELVSDIDVVDETGRLVLEVSGLPPRSAGRPGWSRSGSMLLRSGVDSCLAGQRPAPDDGGGNLGRARRRARLRGTSRID